MISHERAKSRRRAPAAAPGPPERQGSPASNLTDLQRLAGNPAISDLIANRPAVSPTVQRGGETTKDGRRKGELIGRYPDKLRDNARRFAAFLATGLKSGDAPYPPGWSLADSADDPVPGARRQLGRDQPSVHPHSLSLQSKPV